jgi:hypothetical protein
MGILGPRKPGTDSFLNHLALKLGKKCDLRHSATRKHRVPVADYSSFKSPEEELPS